MKPRSEWGSYEDWMGFQSKKGHVEKIDGLFCAGILSYGFENADTPEEARRKAVEMYCSTMGIPLPWRPDFDLSTIAGCKEAIKSCGYEVNIPMASGMVTVIKLEDNYRIKCINVEPTLEQWQQAAQFAIDNHKA